MGSGRAFDDVSAARVAMREVRRVDSSVFARSEQAANGQVGIHPMLDIKNRRGGRFVPRMSIRSRPRSCRSWT